jgi:hypothetical protein
MSSYSGRIRDYEQHKQQLSPVVEKPSKKRPRPVVAIDTAPSKSDIASSSSSSSSTALVAKATKPPPPLHLLATSGSANPVAPSLSQQQQVQPRIAHPFRIKKHCVVAIRVGKLPTLHTTRTSTATRTTTATTTPTAAESAESFRYWDSILALQTSKQEVPSQTTSHNTLTTVWCDPLPHRDVGLALIGQRIRCFLPITAVRRNSTAAAAGAESKASKAVTAANATTATATTAVEGEVIQIYNDSTDSRVFTVDLLVESSKSDIAGLRSKSSPTVSAASLSPKQQRQLELEAQIRGSSLHSIQVTLHHPAFPYLKDTASTTARGSQWVIQKRLVASAAVTKSSSGGANRTTTAKSIHNDKSIHDETSKGKKRGKGEMSSRDNGDGTTGISSKDQTLHVHDNKATPKPTAMAGQSNGDSAATATVGAFVGALVGDLEGPFVGIMVGDFEGRLVGSSV